MSLTISNNDVEFNNVLRQIITKNIDNCPTTIEKLASKDFSKPFYIIPYDSEVNNILTVEAEDFYTSKTKYNEALHLYDSITSKKPNMVQFIQFYHAILDSNRDDYTEERMLRLSRLLDAML